MIFPQQVHDVLACSLVCGTKASRVLMGVLYGILVQGVGVGVYWDPVIIMVV